MLVHSTLRADLHYDSIHAAQSHPDKDLESSVNDLQNMRHINVHIKLSASAHSPLPGMLYGTCALCAHLVPSTEGLQTEMIHMPMRCPDFT